MQKQAAKGSSRATDSTRRRRPTTSGPRSSLACSRRPARAERCRATAQRCFGRTRRRSSPRARPDGRPCRASFRRAARRERRPSTRPSSSDADGVRWWRPKRHRDSALTPSASAQTATHAPRVSLTTRVRRSRRSATWGWRFSLEDRVGGEDDALPGHARRAQAAARSSSSLAEVKTRRTADRLGDARREGGYGVALRLRGALALHLDLDAVGVRAERVAARGRRSKGYGAGATASAAADGRSGLTRFDRGVPRPSHQQGSRHRRSARSPRRPARNRPGIEVVGGPPTAKQADPSEDGSWDPHLRGLALMRSRRARGGRPAQGCSAFTQAAIPSRSGRCPTSGLIG